jgi:hypothetical protein
MQLKDFNTLDEAKAYSETQGKLISPEIIAITTQQHQTIAQEVSLY